MPRFTAGCDRTGNPADDSVARLAWPAAAIFGLTQIPLYALEYPPITDLPAHVARLHTLINLSDSAALQRYYAHSFNVAPNLAMDLIVPLLASVFDLLLAFKLFVSLATLLLCVGTVALSRALHGSVSPWLLGVPLFAHNLFVHYGLVNYVLGLGAALGALAWRVRRPPRTKPTAMLGGALILVALYFIHLSALGVYLVGLAGMAIAGLRTTARDRFAAFRRSLQTTAMQLIPVALIHLLLAQPRGTFMPVEQGELSWTLLAIRKLALLGLAPFLAVSADPRVGALVVVIGAAIGVVLLRRAQCALSAVGLTIAMLLVAAVLVMPDAGFGSGALSARLMLPAVLIAWASVGVKGTTRDQWRACTAIAAIAAVITSGHAWLSWRAGSSEHAHARAALSRLEPGSRIATVALQRSALAYAGAWAVIDNAALLSNGYFRPFNAVWVTLKDEHAAQADLARTDDLNRRIAGLGELCGRYDYVVLVGPPNLTGAYAPCAASLYVSAGLRLLRVPASIDEAASCHCAAGAMSEAALR